MDIRKIYEYALQREYEGKSFFEHNAGRLSNAAATNAFKKLAVEEQKHIEFIQTQIASLGKGNASSAELGQALEKAGSFSHRAMYESVEQTVAESMVADLPVLRMAFLIERDFAEFYEMAASKSSGNAKDALAQLAGWERVHER